MTYLVILTRTVKWADTDFRMLACGTLTEAEHHYYYELDKNDGGYGVQTGTTVRIVQVRNGIELMELRKHDFVERYTP